MTGHEGVDIIWRKSSYSGANGACMEVASALDGILVRDSKDRDGSTLFVPALAWHHFLLMSIIGYIEC